MSMPSFQDITTTIGLYKQIDYSFQDAFELYDFFFNDDTIDVYCISCKEKRIFNKFVNSNQESERTELMRLFNPFPNNYNNAIIINRIKNKQFNIEFNCAKDNEHKMYFNFLITDKYLIKIGQYPSFADLHTNEYKKYNKILPKEQLHELNKANGLFAHGVGAGSFIYLRRIFEFLLEEAYNKAKVESTINEDDYIKSRIKEKINLLKIHIPDFMADNPQIYSVLSKAVHSMSEEDCLKYFEIVKSIIEFILDDKLKMIEDENKRIEVIKALDKIK